MAQTPNSATIIRRQMGNRLFSSREGIKSMNQNSHARVAVLIQYDFKQPEIRRLCGQGEKALALIWFEIFGGVRANQPGKGGEQGAKDEFDYCQHN